jgi:hypothetical protein
MEKMSFPSNSGFLNFKIHDPYHPINRQSGKGTTIHC